MISKEVTNKGLGLINLANQCNITARIVYQTDDVTVMVGGDKKVITYAMFDQLEPVEILELVTGEKRWDQKIT